MILHGNQRGGAAQLSRHLLNAKDNEHVEVHEVRGFVAEDLSGALHEAYALSRGTRCRQFLFSVSLNPPEREQVDVDIFEDAADRIERRLGLEGQPRIIVFHEKEGRRHAHTVWSRIDAEQMKAVQLSHYKSKLRDVAKELYFDHGWKMPRGFVDQRLRDPTAFSLQEWQQSKRAKLDARDLKRDVQECYAASDNRAAFSQALKERGLWLAKGDRRGHVALHHSGEVFALSRLLGMKTKELDAKLGTAKDLPTLADRKQEIAEAMHPAFHRMMDEARTEHEQRTRPIEMERQRMTGQHRADRQRLNQLHADRVLAEDKDRAARLKKGLFGLWQWVTGGRGKILAQNEQEKAAAEARDQGERQALIDRQRSERQGLQERIRQSRDELAQQLRELHRDRQQMHALDTEFTKAKGKGEKPIGTRTRPSAKQRAQNWRDRPAGSIEPPTPER
ncbi:MAG: relaxase/mobilization nuclease domain-containing protein [Alphaproteobacteria bacterium]